MRAAGERPRALPLAGAAGLAGCVGLDWHLARWMSPIELPPPVCALLAAPAAALFIAALAAALAQPPPTDSSWTGRWRATRIDGWQRGWPVMVPLALLPAVGWLPAAAQRLASAGLFLVAALLFTMLRRRASPSNGIGLLVQSDSEFGVWQLALLALVLATAVLYLVIGSRVPEISDNDGAYYYGVARHMALTGRFEEPIVWHFLHPPDHIVHAPFDYWGGMTSLLLVPSLAVFGATPRTAFLTISAISAASLLAFWYLVCFALPLRYWVTQLLALLLFAFSHAMAVFRFQPESTVVAHLFILLSLIAYCRRHLVLALLAGFGILLTRGDGVILFGLIVLAVLFDAWRQRDGRRRLAQLALVALACMATYVLWSLVSFGTPTPPAPQQLPLLDRYAQVFDYGVAHPTVWQRLGELATWDYLAGRIALGLNGLRSTPFTPALELWLAIGFLSGLGWWRARSRAATLIWVLCFGGYLFGVLVAGPGFNWWRTPFTFTPLIILTGAMGIDDILSTLRRWVERAPDVRSRALLAGAGVVGLCAVFLGPLEVVHLVPGSGKRPLRADLTQLDQVLNGEPVASNVPWYMIAYTRSPTVSIPYNGEAAIADVIERYGVRWMVIFGEPQWVEGDSRAVLQDVLAGTKTNLERFQLERTSLPTAQAVYRVKPATSDEQ